MTRTVNEYMTLKEARNFIPRFDGTELDEVDDIIEAYSYAHRSVAIRQRNSFGIRISNKNHRKSA